jgi:hypothetical protein
LLVGRDEPTAQSRFPRGFMAYSTKRARLDSNQ